jgi:GNAT superfamily N-acetyltransferase
MRDPMYFATVLLMQEQQIANPDFEAIPKYYASFSIERQKDKLKPDIERKTLIISVLYVSPEYRGKGYARALMQEIFSRADGLGCVFVQAAVAAEKVNSLRAFYEKFGFISTNGIHTDELGERYTDFFWSRKRFKLQMKPNGEIGVGFI